MASATISTLYIRDNDALEKKWNENIEFIVKGGEDHQFLVQSPMCEEHGSTVVGCFMNARNPIYTHFSFRLTIGFTDKL